MKIQNRLSPWQFLGEKITMLLSPQKERTSPSRKLLKLNNHFLSWPNIPKRLLAAQSGYSLPPTIDIKRLELFMKGHKTQQGIGPRFGSLDDWRGLNVHQALAVKKMAILVYETMIEMKRVELIHVGTIKG